jgi:hypothetical protein
MATLFQPQIGSVNGRPLHPVLQAFVAACDASLHGAQWVTSNADPSSDRPVGESVGASSAIFQCGRLQSAPMCYLTAMSSRTTSRLTG